MGLFESNAGDVQREVIQPNELRKGPWIMRQFEGQKSAHTV